MTQPVEHADQVAEAVRGLIHATMWHREGGGWEFPSDAYDVIGGLQVAAMRMPQALQQAGKFIEHFAAEGTLGVDASGPPDVATSQAALGDALVDAIKAAEALALALALAHAHAAHLTYRTD